ncbi:pyridoxamine 5'-phosphate oxidase family protein [Geodermatophilus marinus]|uniref:pyridoxamine 5'-phosphate oxidase family protein n=1 Tax=Geodermatophilus sp. LHW52908 TaxID=2303986 RepID=UPI000E3D7AE4|nr:pyridoxamine 5'-phosphate oxidase family protein [Geodermatophilus sp. LHW52908]RFU23338.1 pyridoxamine 5'-phosphate oxidase family protein [Geodermatophilus sp. LHW52908]
MDTAPPLSPTARSTVRRAPRRARTDRRDLYAVLDAGLIGHLAVVLGDAPVVLPTGYGRDGDTLYLHGSTRAATLRAAAAGAPVCFTVTHLDGVVYARSAFHHSVNYRCAVVHGTARLLADPDERRHGLAVLTEHLAPGSWSATRRPDRRELAATAVLALDLTEASVKVRTGPPGDDERDLPAAGDPDPVWAGVLPVRTVLGAPEPCPLLPPGTPVPGRVRDRAPVGVVSPRA